MYDHKFPSEDVEDAAEYERYHGTGEDDDVVRHAEIGSGEVNQKIGGVYPSICEMRGTLGNCFQRRKNGRRKIPTPLSIRLMLGVSEERLRHIHGDANSRIRWNRQQCLEGCWS